MPSADFVSRALSISQQFDRVWIMDNDDLRGYHSFALLRDASITHVRCGLNVGVAAAQNAGFELAQGEGFRWIVLLDQDTKLPSNFGLIARDAIAKGDADPAIAMFAPEYEDHGIRRGRVGTRYRSIKLAIASGSLIRTESYRAVGGMDSRLFIDYVDYDFCFKIAARHFRILSLPVTISHTVGNLTRHRLFFWWVSTSNHEARRLFSAGRNLTILSGRNWRYRPVTMLLLWGFEFRRLVFISLFESQATNKVWAFLLGVVEGLRYGDSRDLTSSPMWTTSRS